MPDGPVHPRYPRCPAPLAGEVTGARLNELRARDHARAVRAHAARGGAPSHGRASARAPGAFVPIKGKTLARQVDAVVRRLADEHTGGAQVGDDPDAAPLYRAAPGRSGKRPVFSYPFACAACLRAAGYDLGPRVAWPPPMMTLIGGPGERVRTDPPAPAIEDEESAGDDDSPDAA